MAPQLCSSSCSNPLENRLRSGRQPIKTRRFRAETTQRRRIWTPSFASHGDDRACAPSCQAQPEVKAMEGRLELSPQLTAFFTSALILASSAALNPFSAKATGHRAPSSRFAASLNPSVAYLVLNFCALWKWQTTLPSLAYAGIPYQVVGEREGALALMMAWSRLPMARSGSRISAIFASRALSPSALASATFCSWTRAFIASRSSSVNPSYLFLVAAGLLADFCFSFIGGFLPVNISCERPSCYGADARLSSGSPSAQ